MECPAAGVLTPARSRSRSRERQSSTACPVAGRHFDTGRRNPNRSELASSARRVALQSTPVRFEATARARPRSFLSPALRPVLGTPVPIGTAVLVGAAFAAGLGKSCVNADQSNRSMDGRTHRPTSRRTALLDARRRLMMFSSGSVVSPRYAMPSQVDQVSCLTDSAASWCALRSRSSDW